MPQVPAVSLVGSQWDSLGFALKFHEENSKTFNDIMFALLKASSFHT
jgi:hypothetical protein